MSRIRIIPAIDIIGGECVRLTQGDYGRKTVYGKDPVEVAMRFREAGIERLHLVDLDGAAGKAPVNLRVLERIVARTSITVQFGGGIKSVEALEAVLDAGASYAICGSVAVREREMFRQWLEEYGSSIILAVDVRDGKVAVQGWKEAAGTGAEELLESLLNESGESGKQRQGLLKEAICTDISRDGMLQGPDTGFYRGLQEKFPEIDITVSGGIGGMEDIRRLDEAGLKAVIVGKAFYEGKITLEEMRCWQKG